MKSRLFVVLVVGLLCASSYGDFSWYNTSINRVYYLGGSGSSGLLVGSSSSSVGCFVQLIYAPDGVNYGATLLDSKGVQGGNVVVATSWIGNNVPFNAPGRYNSSSTIFTDDVAGGYYYVRFWSAPSTNYAAGAIPGNPTNYYCDSQLWQNPGGASDVMNILPEGGIDTDLKAVIPEPAVLSLGVIGLICLRLFARKK